jgi:hypothetical protein
MVRLFPDKQVGKAYCMGRINLIIPQLLHDMADKPLTTFATPPPRVGLGLAYASPNKFDGTGGIIEDMKCFMGANWFRREVLSSRCMPRFRGS